MKCSARVKRARLAFTALTAVSVLVPATTASADGGHQDRGRYDVKNLVSDVPGRAQLTDANLANAWGLAAGPSSPIWVANNHTDTSTLYRGATAGQPVSAVPLVVHITGGAPTGVVFNAGPGFVVSSGPASGSSLFIFASEGGDLTGWNPNVPPPAPSTVAQPAAHVDGAVYKGLAIATTRHGTRLLAANFAAGTVDVFDDAFTLLHGGGFTDRRLPAGYAPFNVVVLGDLVYVTYAQQDPNSPDDVKGAGHGFIDVYDTDGRLQRRLVSRGRLDSPWGVALAPHDFGEFADMLLVGNFGDGRINVYDPRTGRREGTLRGRDERPITIDGLWALRFGNPTIGGSGTLLFSAGPDGEEHGLFGTITPRRHDDND